MEDVLSVMSRPSGLFAKSSWKEPRPKPANSFRRNFQPFPIFPPIHGPLLRPSVLKSFLSFPYMLVFPNRRHWGSEGRSTALARTAQDPAPARCRQAARSHPGHIQDTSRSHPGHIQVMQIMVKPHEPRRFVYLKMYKNL